MKIELTSTPLLEPAEIGALASSLDALHGRVLKAIERLQADVQARKVEISKRWGLPPQHAGTEGGQLALTRAEMDRWSAVPAEDRARFAQNETLAVVREIRANSEKELDGYLKAAGAPHAQLIAQRQFYDSPVKVLSRAALGTPQRTAYLQQLEHAGPAELAHLAQVAVSTQNVPLAAAVLSLLDRMPSKDRPLGPADLARAMRLEDFLKVGEYIKLGDARLQGIIVAVRTWKQGRSNPINTVQLALREQAIDRDLIGGGGE